MWSDIARAAEITRIGSAWLPILFDAAVKGVVVLGLAGAATLLMRRCSAAARHLVWCLAVASLPVLPILSSVSPDWHVLPRWMAMSTDIPGEVSLAAAAEPTAPGEPTATQEAVLPGDRANMAEVPIEPAARQPTPPNVVEQPEADRPAATAPPRPPDLAPNQAGPSRAVPWQTWGLLAWLVGTLLTLVPVGLGMLSLWRLRRRAEPITGGPWISQLHQLTAQLGVSRRMVLLRSNRRSMPMHWGILRPKLLLPAVADRWPDDRRRVVLLHELAHVKRWDCLAQLVTQLACALYWFNPLVWVALRQMHLEREAACDDLILRAGYRPPDYAEHLLQIASGLQADLFATYSAIAMARPSRLESRLRAILDAGRNRRTLTRAAVLVIVTLLAGAVVPVAMMRAANGEKGTDEDQTAKDATAPAETEADGRTYDHFLYVRHNQKGGVAKTDTLVLARVTSGGFEQRDLYTKNNFNIGWTPLCVIDGTVYGVKIDDLIAIDVATGRAERICSHVRSHAYNAGRLYTIVPTGGDKPVLRVFDFHKRAYRDVGPVDVDWSRPPIAVSPDHRRLAFFEGLGNVKTASSFRLHLVDLKTGRVETPGPTVHSMPFMTGGGDVCDGPPFVWLDPKTILLVHDVPKNVPKDPARFISFSGGEVGVATMDVTGGKLTDLLKLPRWQRRLREPYLRPLGKDGVPRIVMGELGQYRIDVRAKRLLEDDRIGGDYRWSRGRQPERLSHGKTPLIEAERIPEVAVSPGGRRLVWLTKRGSTDAELRYHDAYDKAVRVVAQGWFPTIWEPHRRPEETIFLWGSTEDLAPGEKSRPPAGWKPFSTGPWPKSPGRREVDERPDVIDFLTMTLSTDKRAYEHHQPVKLTVTLANKSETDVTFKRPEGYTNFFRLRMRYPRGSRVVDEFSRPEEVFKTDPVVVKAGTSFQCTRTLEPWDLGEHQVEGGFRLNTRQWRGRLKTETIRFVVQKSPDEDRLLKAKFDRFLAQCRREFESDPMRCDYARFFDLGPAAVPHLVAALEASDDPKFRRRMGYALARMANADAIPYFEKLLKGEMKTDSEMVLEGLLTMYRQSRSPNEALRLLLEALKHSNAGFRRGAAERLSQIYDRRVAAGFERAVADADKRTAVTVARYLAAYEGLDLADWLEGAAEQPTPARYLAAPSIIKQLEKRWDLHKGDLPEVAWEDLAKDPAKLAQYKKVLRAWQQWARENPRFSARFFNEDRKPWPKENRPSGAKPSSDAGNPAADAGTAARKGSYVAGRVLDVPGGKAAAGVSVGLWHSGDGKTWSARTDKLGRYSFQDVPASGHEYVLRVGNLPAGVWSEGTSVTVGEKDVRAGDLYLSRPQSISGVVRDVATREPVAGVGINFSTADAKGNRAAVTTDAQGRFRLYVVPREVELHCEGTADRYYPETKGKTVTVKASQHLGDVDFVVLNAPAFTGRILLPDGKPAGNLDVYGDVHWSWGSVQDQQRIADAKKRKGNRQPSPDEGKLRPFVGEDFGRSMGPGFGQGFHRKTDKEGRFQAYLRQPSLTDRDAAVDIILFTRLADHSLAGMKVVQTTTLDPPPDPVELKLVPTGVAVFTVVNPDGQPIDDAKPRTSTMMRNVYWGATPPRVQPRFEASGSGRYRASGLIPGWGYGISATAEGYRCRSGLSAVVKPGDTLDAGTLRLDWWGKKAVPGLIKRLSSKDRYARAGACRELGELGPVAAEAVPTLIHLLNDDPLNTVRFQAAAALGAIGPAAEAAVPDLIRALRHDKHGVPREAAKALGRLGPAGKAAVPDLMHALRKHRELDVRLNAVASLGLLGEPVALPALKDALMDGHYLVREAALKELAKPVFRNAEPEVATLLRLAPLTRDTKAMTLALRAIQAAGAEGNAPVTVVIQQARFGDVQPDSALRVLQVLTGQRFADYEEVLAWWWSFPPSQPAARPADRGAAPLEALWARLAGPVGPDTYRAILSMAAGGDDAVSFIARSVKPVSAEATRIKSLIAELDHDEYAARRRALLELSRLGRAAEPHLRTALGSGPSFEARKSIEQLLEASAKPYPALPEARRTARAIRVLELIGTDQSVAVLRDLAKGIPKAFATEHAQAALRRMGRSQPAAPSTQPGD